MLPAGDQDEVELVIVASSWLFILLYQTRLFIFVTTMLGIVLPGRVKLSQKTKVSGLMCRLSFKGITV